MHALVEIVTGDGGVIELDRSLTLIEETVDDGIITPRNEDLPESSAANQNRSLDRIVDSVHGASEGAFVRIPGMPLVLRRALQRLWFGRSQDRRRHEQVSEGLIGAEPRKSAPRDVGGGLEPL